MGVLTQLDVRDHTDQLRAWAAALEGIAGRVITSEARKLTIVAASMRATAEDLRRTAG